MAVYGLQADVDTNKGKNVILYQPGKTKITPQDVFLGSVGTGVTDEELNGATRVFGNNRYDTARAFNEYNSDLPSQIRAVIAANAAPRVEADRGIPTLARQQLELQQAQNQIGNTQNIAQLTGMYNGAPTLAQKSFDHSVMQDKFNNGINTGQLMGVYGGNDTLSKQAQNIQNAQFYAQLGQDASQFDKSLYAKANTPSASEKTRMNVASAMEDVQKALDAGTSPDEVKRNIISRATDYELNGVTPNTLLSFVDSVIKTWGEDEINPAVTESNAISAWNSLNNLWNRQRRFDV